MDYKVNLNIEEKFDRVREKWDFKAGFFPVPRFTVFCPVCHAPEHEIKLADWTFFKKRTGTDTPFRCDVRFKCTNCSFVLTFGVLIPNETFKKIPYWKHNYIWSEGFDIIEGRKTFADFDPNL